MYKNREVYESAGVATWGRRAIETWRSQSVIVSSTVCVCGVCACVCVCVGGVENIIHQNVQDAKLGKPVPPSVGPPS